MRDHRSLLCWRLARDLSTGAYRLTISAGRSPRTWAAFDQLRRAALSVRLNIVEGYALGTPRYFARHLTIAYGSAVECAEVLEFCVEAGLLTHSDTLPLLSLSSRIQALILKLRSRCLDRGRRGGARRET